MPPKYFKKKQACNKNVGIFTTQDEAALALVASTHASALRSAVFADHHKQTDAVTRVFVDLVQAIAT